MPAHSTSMSNFSPAPESKASCDTVNSMPASVKSGSANAPPRVEQPCTAAGPAWHR